MKIRRHIVIALLVLAIGVPSEGRDGVYSRARSRWSPAEETSYSSSSWTSMSDREKSVFDEEEDEFWSQYVIEDAPQSGSMPTSAPSGPPSPEPSAEPSEQPSSPPTPAPSVDPTESPSSPPSPAPSAEPSGSPSSPPSPAPTVGKTLPPTHRPTFFLDFGTDGPEPTSEPSLEPSGKLLPPSLYPTRQPSMVPSSDPTSAPSKVPSTQPSLEPSMDPSDKPSSTPSVIPSESPSDVPSVLPSNAPTMSPSQSPSVAFSIGPTVTSSDTPSAFPTNSPSDEPTVSPSGVPSTSPSGMPSISPTESPSMIPSVTPSGGPSVAPSSSPSDSPSETPSVFPSQLPSGDPSAFPSDVPSVSPSKTPSNTPSVFPSNSPSGVPSVSPSDSPSDSPSVSPSDAPSESPTDEPSTSPSEEPSSVPSLVPSSGPSTLPSVQPSRGPTNRPSLFPTDAPSRQPSAMPSNAQCDVEVDIGCTSTGGIDCNVLDFPKGTCAVGESINVLTFSYQNCLCSDSKNNQHSSTSCEDFASIETEGNVMIFCFDEDENLMKVDPMMVSPGGFFIVRDYMDVNLPMEITCVLANTSGERLQRNVINTSGQVTLDLRDKFGAMQLESCDDLSCTDTLTYTYELKNVGSSVMNVTKVERTYNKNVTDLLDMIKDNPLDPGQSTSLKENQTVDLCVSMDFCTDIAVEAEPQDGKTCFAGDSHKFDVTPFPTTMPSSMPSLQPSMLPSMLPSLEPSAVPSSAPTPECTVDLDLNCTLPDGRPCDVPLPAVEPCAGRPYMMGMLLRGGFCNQSDNIQPDKFICEDFGAGPPKPRSGDTVYLIVTDAKGKGHLYFEGFIQEGDIFYMDARETDKGEVEADSNITMYATSETVPSNIIQTLQFHSSCSSNLRLKDTFGASQLVLWINEEQGNISCFKDVQYDLQINVPVDIDGDNVTITSLTVNTNFANPPYQDLTDQVANMTISAGGSFLVSFDATFDLTEKRRYIALIRLEAITDLGIRCFGLELSDFVAGSPAPPAFPTFWPTVAPTRSPYPTPDPFETPCSLKAEIECTVSNTDAQCSDLSPPSAARCQGGNPSKLRFIYKGLPCTSSNTTGRNFDCSDTAGGPQMVSPISIRITDRNEDFIYFEDTVYLGELFVVDSRGDEFEDRLEITISDLSGDRLQFIEIRATCNDMDDISLMTRYGALELVGFESPGQGLQNAIEDIEYSFIVNNVGKLSAIAAWANKTCDLTDNESLISPPGIKLGPRTRQEFTFMERINLYQASGSSFFSALEVVGIGDGVSETGCNSTVEYEFVV